MRDFITNPVCLTAGEISASIYCIEQNFGGKNFWRNCDFEMLAEKTLANPRLACILIIVRTRQL